MTGRAGNFPDINKRGGLNKRGDGKSKNYVFVVKVKKRMLNKQKQNMNFKN